MQCVQGNKMRVCNFWKRINIFIFVLWAKTFWTFGGKSSEGLSKLNSTCPEECLMFFWKRYISFYHFRNISGELSKFWPKNFSRLVKNAIWVSRCTFRGKTVFEKNLWYMFLMIVFGLRAIFFRTLTRIFEYRCPNCILNVHWKGLSKNFFPWKILFWFIFVILVTNLVLLAKKLQQCRHNGFLGIQRNVLGKKSLKKLIRQACQKCNLSVQGNFLRRN